MVAIRIYNPKLRFTNHGQFFFPNFPPPPLELIVFGKINFQRDVLRSNSIGATVKARNICKMEILQFC